MPETAAPTESIGSPEGSAAAEAGAPAEFGFGSPEIQSKFKDLIRLAKEQEYLTYDDVNAMMPEDVVSSWGRASLCIGSVATSAVPIRLHT